MQSARDRDKGRDVARHSAIYVLGSAISAAGGLLLVPVYTSALTPAQYGLLETVLRFVTICNGVAFVGLRQGYLRLFFDQTDPDWQRTVTASTLIANLVAVGGMMLPLFLLASFAAPRFGFPEFTPVAAVAFSLWLLLESSYLLLLSHLQVRMRSVQFVLIQSARLVAMVVTVYLILTRLRNDLEGALIANFVVAAVSGSIGGAILVRWSRLQSSRLVVRDLFAFALPYIPTALFVYVLNNADRAAVLYGGAIASLGLLTLASKLGEMALSIFITPIERVWAPFAFAVHADADGPRKIGDLYTRYTALCVFLAMGISLAAPEAVRLLAAADFMAAGELVPIVAIGGVFSGLASLSDLGMLIAKQTRLKPVIFGVTAAVAVALQALITPRYGVVGAAVATTLTTAFLFVSVRYFSNRYYRIKTRQADFLVIIVAASAAYLLGTYLRESFPGLGGAMLAIVVATTVYLFALIRRSIVSADDIRLVVARIPIPPRRSSED